MDCVILDTMNVCVCVCIFPFCVQVVCSCVSKRNYLDNNFFFLFFFVNTYRTIDKYQRVFGTETELPMPAAISLTQYIVSYPNWTKFIQQIHMWLDRKRNVCGWEYLLATTMTATHTQEHIYVYKKVDSTSKCKGRNRFKSICNAFCCLPKRWRKLSYMLDATVGCCEMLRSIRATVE